MRVCVLPAKSHAIDFVRDVLIFAVVVVASDFVISERQDWLKVMIDE